MDVIAIILGGLRVIFGFLFLLFIPGFTVMMVLFPRYSDIRFIERLVYSLVLSIGSVIVYVLFMDIVLGIDTTPRNIFLVLSGLTLILLNVWVARFFFIRFSLTEKITYQVTRGREMLSRSVSSPEISNLLLRLKNRIRRTPRDHEENL